MTLALAVLNTHHWLAVNAVQGVSRYTNGLRGALIDWGVSQRLEPLRVSVLDPGFEGRAMTVITFPDEIIRRFLERLDQSPRFSYYLDSLGYCARKDLDPSALQRWWQTHSRQIKSDNLELDFVAFLNKIIVSKERWEDAKQRVQESLQRSATKSPTEEGSTENLIQSVADDVNEAQVRRHRFIDENPEYRCIESAEQWHQVFEEIFSDNSPLKIIARWCAQLLPCGLPKSLREDDYVSGWSDAGRFGMEVERPAAFLIGSPAHAHLLDLSAWVSKRLGRPQLRTRAGLVTQQRMDGGSS